MQGRHVFTGSVKLDLVTGAIHPRKAQRPCQLPFPNLSRSRRVSHGQGKDGVLSIVCLCHLIGAGVCEVDMSGGEGQRLGDVGNEPGNTRSPLTKLCRLGTDRLRYPDQTLGRVLRVWADGCSMVANWLLTRSSRSQIHASHWSLDWPSTVTVANGSTVMREERKDAWLSVCRPLVVDPLLQLRAKRERRTQYLSSPSAIPLPYPVPSPKARRLFRKARPKKRERKRREGWGESWKDGSRGRQSLSCR